MLGPADGPLPEDRRRRCCSTSATPSTSSAGRYLTAEDVGTSMQAMTVIAESHAPRHRAAGRARRLGRSEPVDRARRGERAARRLRARVRHVGRSRAAASRWSASATSAATSRAGSPRAGARLVVADVDERKRALADELGADLGRPRRGAAPPRSTCSPRARSAASSTTTASARCAAGRSAAPPTTSSPPTRSPTCSPPAASSGCRTSSPTPAGSSTSRSSSSPRATRPSAPTLACAAIGETIRTVLAQAEATGTNPLASAMELARRRLAEAGVAAAASPYDSGLTVEWAVSQTSAAQRGSGGSWTPAGSRPSSRSFSRCARQRDRGGRAQARPARRPTRRRAARRRRVRPSSSASSSRRSRSMRWRDVARPAAPAGPTPRARGRGTARRSGSSLRRRRPSR